MNIYVYIVLYIVEYTINYNNIIYSIYTQYIYTIYIYSIYIICIYIYNIYIENEFGCIWAMDHGSRETLIHQSGLGIFQAELIRFVTAGSAHTLPWNSSPEDVREYPLVMSK